MVVSGPFKQKSTYSINRPQTTAEQSLWLKAVTKSYCEKFAMNHAIAFASPKARERRFTFTRTRTRTRKRALANARAQGDCLEMYPAHQIRQRDLIR